LAQFLMMGAAFLQRSSTCCFKFIGCLGDMHMGAVAPHFGQIRRHHRQARGEVLAEFDRIDIDGQRIDLERNQPDIECFAICGKLRKWNPPKEIHVGEARQAVHRRRLLPDQNEGPFRTTTRHFGDQL